MCWIFVGALCCESECVLLRTLQDGLPELTQLVLYVCECLGVRVLVLTNRTSVFAERKLLGGLGGVVAIPVRLRAHVVGVNVGGGGGGNARRYACCRVNLTQPGRLVWRCQRRSRDNQLKVGGGNGKGSHGQN